MQIGITRRAVLRFGSRASPFLLAGVNAGRARAFRTEGLSPSDALAWHDRCKPDQFHAAGLEEAIGKLKAAGIQFDEARLRATTICPICGCPILIAARP